MSALTTATTFFPSSFQLKLAIGSRRHPVSFYRVRLQNVGRGRVSFVSLVVRSSAAVSDNGSERLGSGNSSWNNLDSPSDGFSGWANADADRQSGDPKPKRSLVGILGAGAVGAVMVAGLIAAAMSMSRKRAPIKTEMGPLTTKQEMLLSSDDGPNQVQDDKVGRLESSSEASPIGTNGDPSLYIENNETIGAKLSDNTGLMSQSLEDGDGYVPTDVQRESATDDSLVSLEAPDKPPSSNVTDDLLAFQSNNGNTPSVSGPSVFDANLENSTTENPNGVSSLNEKENGLPQDPSFPETSILNISIKSQLDTVIESGNIQEEFVGSGSVLSARDVERSQDLLTVDVDPLLEVSVDGDDKSPATKNLNGNSPVGAPLAPEVAYRSGNERHENEFNDINVVQSFFDSTDPGNFFTSAGIPAPSAPLKLPTGKVLVPAVIDQLQSQAFSALQVLKVIEDGVQPGDLCTRREYARWLVSASSSLSRNTTSKVYPAMYIENVSELAFDDITPEDPDFSSIQGLAEAGLIASKLSRRDMQLTDDEDPSTLYFSPESPVSRQDLVSWKMALEKRKLPIVDQKIMQQVCGFIDIDKIHPDAWPALVADLAAGEQGIVTLAFGYTRLFQPEKPVTKAQTAIALSTGDASVIVSEELARIEAESMAEKAVTAHNALVSQVEKDLNTRYEKELLQEREKINVVEKMAEEARKEVEKLRSSREEERLSLMKERASVDSEMEILSRLRREVEEQLQMLMADKLEISYEKEMLNKLRTDAENENREIERLQYELAVERKALSMAR
ncbi:Unknown protein [Striga hermonthica]|uniref:SLH domain-containing protein n=1 Tax=Striga hermonthica TaxID=68872 RepID=A0A9N7RCV9_STRHE|nr:Unknown protein [Striga hermonthica]